MADAVATPASPSEVPVPKSAKAPREPYVPNLPLFLRIPGTIYTVGCLFGGWVLAYTAQMLFKLISFPFTTADQRTDVCGHIFRRFSYLTSVVVNPMWRVTLLRPMPALPKDTTKVIVMMNHLSNADPWVCSGMLLPNDYAWICKGSLFSIPFGGWAMANSGDLKVEFTKEKGGWGTKKGSVGRLMAKAKEYLNRGRGVAVYPEGTRNANPYGPMGEFKLGFFSIACEIGATIVPMAISGTEKMWPNTEAFFDSSRAYVTFGDPVVVNVGENPEEVRDKIFNIIDTLRNEHPDRKAYLAKTA